MQETTEQEKSEAIEPLVVAIGGRSAGAVLAKGMSLALELGRSCELVHVETPGELPKEEIEAVTDAFDHAAKMGATVLSLPAATVADGLLAYLDQSSADQLVLGHRGGTERAFARTPLFRQLLRQSPAITLHLVPTGELAPRPVLPMIRRRAPPLHYLWAAGAVAGTLVAAILLNRIAGIRSLSFLFLFPVIAAAARLGTGPSLFAALLSTIAFNLVFLGQPYMLNPLAVQSWLMAAVLIAIGAYTGALTATLRSRTSLSQRSAQENAMLVAFALDLTRVADWEATAAIICAHVCALLDVHAVLLREVGGELRIAASEPAGVTLDPLDRTALDWAWSYGEAAGSGTENVASANWQFRPLATSLGKLAVLGIARTDGRNPVSAHRADLFLMMTAQAAISLERLDLEEKARGATAR